MVKRRYGALWKDRCGEFQGRTLYNILQEHPTIRRVTSVKFTRFTQPRNVSVVHRLIVCLVWSAVSQSHSENSL